MSRFNADYGGIRDMLTSEFMKAEMVRRAEKVKARAEAIAPFDVKDKDGNHYKDAFKVESGTRREMRNDGASHRAFGRVVNDNEAAIFVEYGTRNNPRHRTLGTALDAAGD